MEKIKTLELKFLRDYPLGFESEEMIEIGKKHNIEKLSSFANEGLVKMAFKNEDSIIDAFKKLVSRSSMVSRFEKPAFKKYIIN